MDSTIKLALENDALIDITTIGRRSGNPHKIEIAFHYFDAVVYISGLPGTRDWYANLLADPNFTFHLKQSLQAELPAVAKPITDEASRRAILTKIVAIWGRQKELEAFVARSPLVRVDFDGDAATI